MRVVKVGIISDTHMKEPSPFLRRVVNEYFRDVEIILHAGDITTPQVLDVFSDKEIRAVCGNGDSYEIERRYPEKDIVEINGKRIGLIHGRGFPFGIERRIRSSFTDVDCIVYGHTHHPVNHMKDGCLLFNPGSFSKGIASFFRRSIGLLFVGDKIEGEIIPL